MIYDVLVDLPGSSSPSEDEVVQAGDAEHGVVDTVAFEAAVAQDLPALHAGQGVLDAGVDLAVGGVVLLLPGREFGLAAFPAVRDDQAGAPVAAVRDYRGAAVPTASFAPDNSHALQSLRLPGSGRP